MAEEDLMEAFAFEPKSGSEQLAEYIKEKFDSIESSRHEEEERWLEAYRQYRGLYGPETQFTSSEKSQVFIKITKTKSSPPTVKLLTSCLLANVSLSVLILLASPRV